MKEIIAVDAAVMNGGVSGVDKMAGSVFRQATAVAVIGTLPLGQPANVLYDPLFLFLHGCGFLDDYQISCCWCFERWFCWQGTGVLSCCSKLSAVSFSSCRSSC